jgi:hypothetical protein
VGPALADWLVPKETRQNRPRNREKDGLEVHDSTKVESHAEPGQQVETSGGPLKRNSG